MSEWRLPAELDVPIPRPVRMSTTYMVLIIFLFVPFIAIAIFMALATVFVVFSVGLTRAIFSVASFCALFSASLFALVYMMQRKYGREKHLLMFGEIASATIVTEYEYDSSSGFLSEVTYSFTDKSGNVFGGTRKGITAAYSQRDERNEIRAQILGNPTALYDPEDSSKNILYPPRFVGLA